MTDGAAAAQRGGQRCRQRCGALAAVLWLASVVAVPALAAGVVDVQSFASAADSVRYRALLDELRCPKCLNTNLSGSDSMIAADLRALVAERVRAGDSDDQVRAFLQVRYGDFILYRPPLNTRTLVLWLGPALLLTVGLGTVVVVARRRKRETQAPLSAEERMRLAELLGPSATDGGAAGAAPGP